MNKETLKYVLAQSAARPLPEVIPRALKLPLDVRQVVTLLGIRRSGKTWLLYETMMRLLGEGVERGQMIFLNFEDDRLLPIRPGELDLILRAHTELHPDSAGRRLYLFLDEVQNAPGWETYVRRIRDTEDVRLYVAGSSSHLLRREVATALRGRTVTFEVFPLSFPEFLTFRGLSHQPYSQVSEGRMSAALEEYLSIGGLPEVVLADESLRPRLLKDYVDLVFYKDLVERYGVARPDVLRILLKHCLGHPACLLSGHKLWKDLQSQGLSLSKDTVYAYLGHLEESFVVFLLTIAERSLRKQAVNPKKMHPVDWALGYPLVAAPRIDVGRKLETAVYLHWRRRREDLAYVHGDGEVDLVVNSERPEQLVNVAYSLTAEETWAREADALGRAGARFPGAEKVLVAHECGPRRPLRGIRVVEAFEYLLASP